MAAAHGRRTPGFYVGAGFFALFVLFLYGPMAAIFILSFQGPGGGLTFPMIGTSLRWFAALFEHQMVDLVADRVGSRFKQLARLVGRSASIVRR